MQDTPFSADARARRSLVELVTPAVVVGASCPGGHSSSSLAVAVGLGLMAGSAGRQSFKRCGSRRSLWRSTCKAHLADLRPCTTVGSAYFWTFIYFGPGRRILAMRNHIELHNDGGLEYVKLVAQAGHEGPSRYARERIAIQTDRGYGQFCRLTPEAEERLVSQYKSEAVSGVATAEGASASRDDREEDRGLTDLAHPRLADCPIQSEEDILFVEDVQDRAPFGIEKKFKIHICPMQAETQLKQNLAPEMQRLRYGLPSACDAFRDATFSGNFHSLGIVPHIPGEQFVCGSGCETAWVRFDKANLQTYDHNLDGLPVMADGAGVMFPVTHLWVDVNFPTRAAYAREWCCGRRCIVRKERGLWPLPNALFRRLVDMTASKLQRAGSDIGD